MVQRTPLCLLALSVVVAACQAPAPMASEAKHTFGETQRPRTSMDDCHDTPVPSDQPEVDLYLEELANVLFAANPATFGTFYTPDKFCFRTEKNDSVNAFALSGSGLITFHTGTVASARNDAHVAAVLAHELAHVTMVHNGKTVHPKLRDHADWQAVEAEDTAWRAANLHKYDEIAARLAKLRAEKDALPAQDEVTLERIDRDMAAATAEGVALAKEQRLLRERMNAVMAAALGIDVLRNWSEQEADEVGYELYLRAGFAAEEYTWMYEQSLGPETDACKATIAAVEAPSATSLARGDGSHPTSCWRVFDISTLEATLHAADYAPFLPLAVKTEVLPGRLAAMQALLTN